MPHETPLISTIVGGIVLAFVFGAIATRLKASPLVGYLLAGVAIGPFTPGFVADTDLAQELAEIGVILLMFGVGLHFSLKDLMSVRRIAIPGAVVQIGFATLLGIALARALGWSLEAGIVFGLALSVASTVVLLRALQERRLIQTERGRVAVGWLIVEDLAMVLALVMLPSWAQIQNDMAASGGFGPAQLQSVAITLLITLGKVAAFVILMLVVGGRVIPMVLQRVVHSGSRELFRLAVLAIALGVAYGAAELFGVSFALGAFFAGMMMGESELSQQAGHETLPLRDAFAVLFFVSVGMLFNPAVLFENPWPLAATVAIIVIGKSIAALAIMAMFRQSMKSGVLIAASLAQIGEFSFILAAMGVQFGMLPETGRDLILAGAIISIVVNPLVFLIADRWPSGSARMPIAPAPELSAITAKQGRAILIGFGRVGSVVGEALEAAGAAFTVIEDRQSIVDDLNARGVQAVAGNAISRSVADEAGLSGADWLFVTVPNGFEAGRIVEMARAANPELNILVRAHSEAEAERLKALGADLIVMAEREIAQAMIVGASALIPSAAPQAA